MRFPSFLLWASLLSWVMLASAHAAEPPVSGKFTVNGKPGNLAFALAVKGDDFDGKPTTVLIFSEKDASKDKKPSFYASFGKFGNSLTITVTPDGSIVGCQVGHSALSTKSFSSVGSIKMTDFKNEGGMVQGKIATEGEQSFFEDKWEVNITFKVKAP